jgi:hypothetical protein
MDMLRHNTIGFAMIAAIMGCAVAAQGASVVGFWNHVSAGDTSSPAVYDFNVYNRGDGPVDFLNVSFQMPGGTTMVAQGQIAVRSGSFLDDSYFFDAGITSGLVERVGFDPSAGEATGLYGASVRTPIAAATAVPVARLALDPAVSIQSVVVGGSIGTSLQGPPAYAHAGQVTDTPFAMALPGDVNLDGDTDLADLSLMARNWGSGTTRRTGDLNADGEVSLSDLSLLARNWGATEDELGPEPPAHMPEPLTMATFGLAGLAVWRKARKRFAA